MAFFLACVLKAYRAADELVHVLQSGIDILRRHTRPCRNVLICSHFLLRLLSESMDGAAPCANGCPGRGRQYPPIKLRAYGTLSGEEKRDGKTSSLVITADNAEKAKLVLAKYLSDLSELPGVSPLSVDHRPRPRLCARYRKAGRARRAALREPGRHPDRARSRAAPAARSRRAFRRAPRSTPARAEIEVPMYLDRWDKYGFRFYYGPFIEAARRPGPRHAGQLRPAPGFRVRRQVGQVGPGRLEFPVHRAGRRRHLRPHLARMGPQGRSGAPAAARHQHRHHRRQHRR